MDSIVDEVAEGMRNVYFQETKNRPEGYYTPWHAISDARKEKWRLMASKAILVVRKHDGRL